MRPSPAKAYVLGQISRFRVLAGRNEEAVAVGQVALAMAEQFGLDSVRAATLNNIGTSRFQAGDEGGLEDLRGAIELAVEANSVELCRAYVNLATCFSALGKPERSLAMVELAAQASERFGDWTGLQFARGQLPMLYCELGRWDEAVRVIAELLEEVPKHYLAGEWRLARAEIALARDDVEQAMQDAADGLEQAREAGDPPIMEPVLVATALIYLQTGRQDEAHLLLDELLTSKEAEGEISMTAGFRLEVGLLARALGEAHRVLAVLDRLVLRSPHYDAARALARGDTLAAAEICRGIPEPSREAQLRLVAAEELVAQSRRAEADAQVRRALPVAQALGATRWVRQGEALLATSA